MTVNELYRRLEEKIPPELSCEWDHDGLAVCPNGNAEVTRVTVALDATDAVIDAAIADGSQVILTHHPLIFHPLFALNERDFVARKVIKALQGGVAIMNFHTRLDAVAGGVNDTLAALFALREAVPFGNPGEEIGRIGLLDKTYSLEDFAKTVKTTLAADAVTYSGNRPVHRLAVLGGSGKDDVDAAIRAGADTFLTGELKHDLFNDAPDLGINLISAGHFDTENPVCTVLAGFLAEIAPTVSVRILRSYPAKTI